MHPDLWKSCFQCSSLRVTLLSSSSLSNMLLETFSFTCQMHHVHQGWSVTDHQEASTLEGIQASHQQSNQIIICQVTQHPLKPNAIISDTASKHAQRTQNWITCDPGQSLEDSCNMICRVALQLLPLPCSRDALLVQGDRSCRRTSSTFVKPHVHFHNQHLQPDLQNIQFYTTILPSTNLSASGDFELDVELTSSHLRTFKHNCNQATRIKAYFF